MRRSLVVCAILASLAGCAGHPSPSAAVTGSRASAAPASAVRLPTRPYLNMPATADGALPARLSQTGVFADPRTLAPAPGLMPYDLVLSFWSDGAAKSRLVAIPDAKVAFSADGEWSFPPGTVFAKTFELGGRRLETRLLVIGEDGARYGVAYKWRPDSSDADLMAPEASSEQVRVRDATGATHEQTWYYPGRQDCLVCHNTHTKGALGPKTRQLNTDFTYPDGITENQLQRWNRLGLFSPSIEASAMGTLPRLARAEDSSRSLEDRARSWLDVNCGHCHRPGGTVAQFDARYETPAAAQNLVDGPVLIDQGVDRARVISPHDPWRSLALMRAGTNDDIRMPPLGRKTVDEKGVALLRAWIESLPGRDVLPPPTISPGEGTFKGPVTVTLASEDPNAEIHYTLDGSAPGTHDPRYTGPIRIDGPTVVRARAYKDGLTRSVIAQRTYLVGP